MHVEARLAAESAWAPEGHLVAWGCFPVSGLMPASDLPRALSPPLPPPPAVVPRGAGPEAAKGEGSRDADAVAVSVAVSAAVPQPSPGFIAYEDEDNSAPSSREVSPLVQL